MLEFGAIVGRIYHDIEYILHWLENQIVHVYVYHDRVVE